MHGAPSTGQVSSAFRAQALAVCSRWTELFVKDSGFVETACLLQPENPMNSGYEPAKNLSVQPPSYQQKPCKSLLQMLFQLPQPSERFPC